MKVEKFKDEFEDLYDTIWTESNDTHNKMLEYKDEDSRENFMYKEYKRQMIYLMGQRDVMDKMQDLIGKIKKEN